MKNNFSFDILWFNLQKRVKYENIKQIIKFMKLINDIQLRNCAVSNMKSKIAANIYLNIYKW